MSQFYFHVRQKAIVFEDTRGGEFPDLAAAWNWAVDDVRKMIEEGTLDGPVDQHWLEISDQSGAVVAQFPFVRCWAH